MNGGSEGNVGIGTTNPGTQAEIYRLETADRTTYSDLLTISAGASTIPYTGHGGGILFRATNYYNSSGALTNSARIGSTINDNSIINSGADLFFDVAPLDDGVLARAMTIKYNGNVGIGTTTPGSILSIQGVANWVASGISTIYNSLRVTTDLYIASLATPAGAFLAIDPNGKVIATSTPSGGGSTSTFYTATGTDADGAEYIGIPVVAGDTIIWTGSAYLAGGTCASGAYLRMDMNYKFSNDAASTTYQQYTNNTNVSGNACSVFGQGFYQATTTGTLNVAAQRSNGGTATKFKMFVERIR